MLREYIARMQRWMGWLGLLVCACTRTNPDYCEVGEGTCLDGTVCNPLDHRCMPACDQAGAGCLADSVCTPTGYCGECTPEDASRCPSATPICASDYTCAPCTTQADCGDGVCLPDGSCVAAGGVTFLAPDGGPGDCSRTAPCGKLSQIAALAAPIIYAAPGYYAENSSFAVTRSLLLVGDKNDPPVFGQEGNIPSVRIAANGSLTVWYANFTHTKLNQPIMRLEASSSVLALHHTAVYQKRGAGAAVDVAHGTLTMADSEISDSEEACLQVGETATATLDRSWISLCRWGILNRGQTTTRTSHIAKGDEFGVYNFGTLTVESSDIVNSSGMGLADMAGATTSVSRSRIANNQNGGLSLIGEYVIVNNWIFENGSETSQAGGGVLLASSATSRFAFNTVVGNQARDTQPAGLICETPTSVIASIMAGNRNALGSTDTTQTNCQAPVSAVMASLTAIGFVDTANSDFHLGSQASPSVHGAAGTTCPLGMDSDIDGEPRPQGDCDIGADEVP